MYELKYIYYVDIPQKVKAQAIFLDSFEVNYVDTNILYYLDIFGEILVIIKLIGR